MERPALSLLYLRARGPERVRDTARVFEEADAEPIAS